MHKNCTSHSPPFRFSLDDVKRMQKQFGAIQKLGARINQEQKEENYAEVVALSIEFLRVLEETLERPHQFFVMATRSLLSSLWILHGSKSRPQ